MSSSAEIAIAGNWQLKLTWRAQSSGRSSGLRCQRKSARLPRAPVPEHGASTRTLSKPPGGTSLGCWDCRSCRWQAAVWIMPDKPRLRAAASTSFNLALLASKATMRPCTDAWLFLIQNKNNTNIQKELAPSAQGHSITCSRSQHSNAVMCVLAIA